MLQSIAVLSKSAVSFNAPVNTICYLRAPFAGTLQRIRAASATAVSGGSAVFSATATDASGGTVNVVGTNQTFSIANGEFNGATANNLNVNLALFDLLQINLVGIPSGGVPAPIQFIFEIEDGQSGGTPLPIASQIEAEAGIDNTKAMTPLRTKQAIAASGAQSSSIGLNLRDFGASGSALQTTGSINSGSNILTVAAAESFAIGHGILIAGAGAGGADLIATISNVAGTTITLASNAGSSVSGVLVQHDETLALKSILTAIGTNSNKIIVPVGYYRFSEYLNSSTESMVAASYLAPGDSKGMYSIFIEGEVTGTTTANPNSNTGVIFDFSRAAARTNSFAYPAFLAAKKYESTEGGLENFSYVVPRIENITFRSAPNSNMAALNLHNGVGAQLKNVFVDLNIPTISASPTSNQKARGIILPGLNNHSWISLQNTQVVGHYDGYVCSEHTKFVNNCVAVFCERGLVVETSFHTIAGQLTFEGCNKFVRFEGHATVDLKLTMERNATQAVGEISAAPGKDARGRIEFRMSVPPSPTSNQSPTTSNVPNLRLVNLYANTDTNFASAITGVFGSSTKIPVLTIVNGLITAISEAPISGGGGTGTGDADADAFIAAAEITNSTQKTAIKNLVVALKEAAIWSKSTAIYPFVGGTAAAHKFNLKDPRDLDAAFRLVFSGGWTHSATGALPNGSTGYANTRLSPGSVLTQNSAHLSQWCRTDSSNTVISGVGDSDNDTYFQLNTSRTSNSGNAIINANTTNIAFFTGVTSTANTFFAGSRLSNTEQKGYVNGALNVTANANSAFPPLATIFIGARNAGNNANFYSNQEISFFTVGEGLTDGEMSALYNAVAAFQVALGR